jgi:hypothetical protein
VPKTEPWGITLHVRFHFQSVYQTLSGGLSGISKAAKRLILQSFTCPPAFESFMVNRAKCLHMDQYRELHSPASSIEERVFQLMVDIDSECWIVTMVPLSQCKGVCA